METEARNITILQECPDLNALLRAWKLIPEVERTPQVREYYYTTRDAAMLGWRRDHPQGVAPVFKTAAVPQVAANGAERRALEEWVATLAEHIAMGSLTNEQAQERCRHIIARRGRSGREADSDLIPVREYHATLRAAARRGVDGLADEAIRIAREIQESVDQGYLSLIMAQRSAVSEINRLVRAGASRRDVLRLTMLADALGQRHREQEDANRQQVVERQRRNEEERQANRLSAVVRTIEALADLEQGVAQGAISRSEARTQFRYLAARARGDGVERDPGVQEAARSTRAAMYRDGVGTTAPEASPRTEIKALPTNTRRIIV